MQNVKNLKPAAHVKRDEVTRGVIVVHSMMILGIARQTLRSKLREMGATMQSSVDVAEGDES